MPWILPSARTCGRASKSEYPHAAGRSVSGGRKEAILIVHCLLMSSPLNAFGQIRPVRNKRLAHESGRRLDPMRYCFLYMARVP